MIYLSLMPYMPPPTSWNPVPHIYFLTWKTGGKQIHCLRFRGWKAVLQWHLVLCVVLYLLMWICVEIENSTRRTISFEAACLGSRGFFQPSSPLISEQGTIYPPPPPSVTFLFSQRKSTALHFHLCTQKFINPSLYTLIYHTSSHILSIFTLKAPYCIYIMIIPDFFLLWMFLCCTPSYLVVYWLLSCGMFVLSQSNVVFTLKPHFS